MTDEMHGRIDPEEIWLKRAVLIGAIAYLATIMICAIYKFTI